MSSSYLDHLPAVFREDRFVGEFLLAFETVLSGRPDRPGLEAEIGRIADYLDPMTTDPEFLPWLSSWVALTLRADWPEATKRGFLQQMVPLYRLRGTQAGLQRMLELYTGERVVVDDDFDAVPHYFQVQLTLSGSDADLLRRKQQIARAIIDQEKPAHTFYALQLAVPTMRLVSTTLQDQEEAAGRERPPRLVLGDNTLLGTSNRSL
jgi:phage tail-like protein